MKKYAGGFVQVYGLEQSKRAKKKKKIRVKKNLIFYLIRVDKKEPFCKFLSEVFLVFLFF